MRPSFDVVRFEFSLLREAVKSAAVLLFSVNEPGFRISRLQDLLQLRADLSNVNHFEVFGVYQLKILDIIARLILLGLIKVENAGPYIDLSLNLIFFIFEFPYNIGSQRMGVQLGVGHVEGSERQALACLYNGVIWCIQPNFRVNKVSTPELRTAHCNFAV